MANVTLSQFSFNQGELAPALHGRSDWKRYSSGAEQLRNLIARPQGGATKRGGLRLAARADDGAAPPLLVPFRFSVRQSYMLVFGDRNMRVLKDGGIVVYPPGHARAGREVVIDSPYPLEALPRLRHAQTADVMILTHPGYPPRRLIRRDHHDWEFSRLLAGASLAVPEGLRVDISGGDGARYVVTAVAAADGESPPSDAVTAYNASGIDAPDASASFSHMYSWLAGRDLSRVPVDLRFDAMTFAELTSFLVGFGYADRGSTHNGNKFHWHCVRPGERAVQSLPWDAGRLPYIVHECLHACDMGWCGNARAVLWEATRDFLADYDDGRPATRSTALSWRPVAGVAGYRVYRERTGDGEAGFRLIGETAAAAFADDDLPARGTALPGSGGLFQDAGDYPGVCAFFEQRLVLARSDNQPTTFWGSDTGQYNAFSRHSPIEDADSYEFTLASGEMNEIHWIVPLNDLIMGTSGGEWKAGGGGAAVTPANINARIQSWYGCSPLPPLVVGRSVVFAGRSGKTLRDFAYSLEADGYSGRDLTGYASHLFVNREIVGLCYQQEPSGVIWVVMSDGALLSCTYAPDEGVVAWSRHETRGRVEACASLVDVDGSDQVYFVVARDIGGATRRFIETLEDAADAVRDESEGFFLDCALGYSGAPTGRVTGLDHLEGERVDCLADGAVFTGLAVRDGAVDLPDGFTAAVIRVGLPYEARLVTLDLEPEAKETMRNRARFAVSAAVRLLASRECLYSHSDGRLSEMKFRTTEAPGRAARLFTGEKNVVFSSPPGARTTRLSFVSRAPTPLTILGIVMEASYGQPA